MRNTSFWWACPVLGAVLLISGCLRPGEGSGEATSAPEALPAVVEHELPPILQGETDSLKHDFHVANTTDRPLEIARVERSCTCTEVKLDAKTLLPGKETLFHVEADVRGRSGPLRLHVAVFPEAGPPWLYELKTTIYEWVRFEEGTLSLGTFEPGAEVLRRATVVTSSREPVAPFPVVSVEHPQGPIEWANVGDESHTQADGIAVRRTTWEIRFRPPAIQGFGRVDLIAAVPSKDKVRRESRLPIQWAIREMYAVSPARIFFSGLPGEKASGEAVFPVSIRRLDGKPVEIASLRASRPELRCSTQQGACADEARIVVAIDPAKIGKFFHGEVTVELADACHSVLRIPVAGSP